MARKNLDDTQKIKSNGSVKSINDFSARNTLSDTQSIKVKPKRWKTVLLGLLFVILFAIGGGGLGYYSGIQQRIARENDEVLTQAAMHYQYGIQAIEAGNYNLAQIQLEYVMQIYPDFPGIQEKYTEVMINLSSSPDTAEAAIEPTPTRDTRGAEALFNQAQQEVQARQWALALQTLEALRTEDYTYRTVEVDGLYFTTLRYRAVELIAYEGNLEEGLYFFAILEKYAPMDHDAVNIANRARLYITGASYWDIDWEQVVNYFGQLAGDLIHDGTGWTATDRYLKGSEYYGDQLASEGKHCEAIQQYKNILNYSALDFIQDKYDSSYVKCYPPTPIPSPTETESTEEPPAEDPTPTPENTPDGGGGGEGEGEGDGT